MPSAWRPDSSFPARRTTRHVNHSSDWRFVTCSSVPASTSSVQRMSAPVGLASSVQPAVSFRRPTRTPIGITAFARSPVRLSSFLILWALPGGTLPTAKCSAGARRESFDAAGPSFDSKSAPVPATIGVRRRPGP